MPAGPKKGKEEEWWQCGKCGRILHRMDSEPHASQGCEVTTCYVLDGVLHVPATGAPSAAVRDTLGKLPMRSRDNVLLLHPSTMAVASLAIGQLCLVGGQHVMTSWPCDGVPTTSVFLPSPVADLIVGGTLSGPDLIVTIRRFVPSGVEAQQVDISMEEDSEVHQTDMFSQMLACRMEGQYVAEGSRHRVSSWGRWCTFHVTSIHALRPPTLPVHLSSPSPSVTRESHSESLADQLASLDLSAVSDSGDNPLSFSPGTPVRQAGETETTCAAQSPEVSTPEQTNRQRQEQFHTPVTSAGQVKGEGRGFVKVTSRTRFNLLRQHAEEVEGVAAENRVTFDCVGGLDRQIEQLRVHCMVPLMAAKMDNSQGPCGLAPSGVLLFGPSGTGKTLLAQALANQLDVYTAHLSPADLYSKFFGETEKKLQSVFRMARQRSPSLIIVDHVDAVCPRRDLATSDLEKRTVTTFLTLMDSLSSTGDKERCVVIGLTCKPDDLDPALRRAGRFDLEIETGVPTASDRLQILRKMLCDVPHSLSDRELKEVADVTHGYVGADLAGVISEGRQHRWTLTNEQKAPLTAEDLKAATKRVSPSAMREVQFEVPQVQWSDIGGQEEVKLKLRQAVEWPLTHPEAFTRLGITPPAGCLLYGPPGCSKTMLAKALATESGLNFLAVKGPELFEKYVGESERAVREIFRKARAAAPSIIFFDEIDSLAVERGRSGGGNNVADRVLTQLLTEMDGVVKLQGVTIVAATNRPDMIDQALLRPGRFDRMLYVPLPDAATRRQVLEIVRRKTPMADDVCLQDLVDRTHNYSGAELTALCQEAALIAMTESVEARQVHWRHFDAAVQVVQPQTSQDLVHFYENYAARRGLEGSQRV